jgi:hypothetical protein
VYFEALDARRSESIEICVGDITPPTTVNVAGITTVVEGSRATYQCSADGFPEPTKMWTGNREGESPLPPNARDDGNGLLTLEVTEEDASRKYCCDVSNEHGQVLSNCIMIDVLIPPEIAKGLSSPFVIVAIPFGATLPLETPRNVTVTVGNSVMIPESYRLMIECKTTRGNPQPSIVWYFGDDLIQGPQYKVMEDGTLVIDGTVRDRDDGIYTCVADTPNVGQDESSSTVLITVPPKVSSSELVTSPGNCLDLTKSLVNTERVGVDLCLRAGLGAKLTLTCSVEEGRPDPRVQWFKDGLVIDGSHDEIRYLDSNNAILVTLPLYSYGVAKQRVEGNYTCSAYNVAGNSTMQSHIMLFGDIPLGFSGDFQQRRLDIYNLLHRTVTEQFPRVKDGVQHLTFFTSGKELSYEDFDPGYLYDESEESVLPQTMENMFDLVDVIPNGGSIVFNPYEAPRLQETYSELVGVLQTARSSLSPEEQSRTRQFFQQNIEDPGTRTVLPRLSLYLLYKNAYYMTKMKVDDLVDEKRRGLLGWEFTQWYERNIHRLQMDVNDAYMKWEMYAGKTEVEEKLDSLNLEDHSVEVNIARALLLASHRMSRFKDEKEYYLVRLYPDTWYMELKNRVRESIEQMQFQLSKLKSEIEILELTARYLEKEMREREALNELFPSLDPVYQLYCDLDDATLKLQQLVKESEDMRYECLISGNPVDCHLYWGLQEHIRDQVLGNYTEFYWYVHTVEAALNHRQYSIPAIANTIGKLESRIVHVQAAINIKLSDLSDRDEEETSDSRDFFTDFMYDPVVLTPKSYYDFTLPSALVGRLMWYMNPESTRLLPNELTEEYNLTINHLNTALTNVSAKLSRVNVHRRWFKAGLFGDKHLRLVDPNVAVSPGEVQPPSYFREVLGNGTYSLPLYPTSLLLATDIELTVDVPFIFHTLPTLIKLSYDPHVTGGFGPFSFGPLHRAKAGEIKFKVRISDNKISITLPGTQLIGYVCDVVPQHPRESVPQRRRRSTRSVLKDAQSGDSEFDHWLFSKSKEGKVQNGLFHKESPLPDQPARSQALSNQRERPITPTAPLNTETVAVYYNSTL